MLWFAYYNFCRIHKSLHVTPAMEAGITDRVWDLAELLARSLDLLATFTHVLGKHHDDVAVPPHVHHAFVV